MLKQKPDRAVVHEDSASVLDPQEAIQTFDRNGVLGELTGVDTAFIEKFFRTAYNDAVERIAQARSHAQDSGKEIVVDASRLSGVNAGEVFHVFKDGRVTKELERFPDVKQQLDCGKAKNGRPAGLLREARPLLLRAAYNGLWSPSGTNWQPIRTLEVSSMEASRILSKNCDACGLVVLARRRYESILGDVAGLCGFGRASSAEWIDLGIWELVAEHTARSHGWRFRRMPIEQDRCEAASAVIKELLISRMTTLSGVGRDACEKLLKSLKAGDHYPACVLLADEIQSLSIDPKSPGGLRPSSFDRLIEARSTQRVASPVSSLPMTVLKELYKESLPYLGGSSSARLACPVFTWDDQLTKSIGQAMVEELEGKNGILQRASPRGFRDYLCNLDGLLDGLDEELKAWTRLPDDDLESHGKDLTVPYRLIPGHLEAKLREAGQFERKDDLLVDRRGRALGPVRLMKLVRLIARSFGQFFLSFHNTHPLLGVVLAEGKEGVEYRQAGRAAIHMTLLGRARGLTSIIKTGPLEIAGVAIKDLLAKHSPDPGCRTKIKAGRLSPMLTFQLGLPLGPYELVSAGKPAEHDGLSERRLDRRAPRAPLSAHYIPKIEE